MFFIGYIIGLVIGAIACKYWYDTKRDDKIFGTIHVFVDPVTMEKQLYLALNNDIDELLIKDSIRIKVNKNEIYLHERHRTHN